MNPNVISPLPLYSSYTPIIITSVLDFYTWITHLSQKLPFNRVFIFSEWLILEYGKREGSLDFTEMMLSSFSLLPNKQRAKRKAMKRKKDNSKTFKDTECLLRVDESEPVIFISLHY